MFRKPSCVFVWSKKPHEDKWPWLIQIYPEIYLVVLPFVIDAGPGRQAAIRGRLAKMDHVVNAILGRHDYP